MTYKYDFDNRGCCLNIICKSRSISQLVVAYLGGDD